MQSMVRPVFLIEPFRCYYSRIKDQMRAHMILIIGFVTNYIRIMLISLLFRDIHVAQLHSLVVSTFLTLRNGAWLNR